MHIIRERRGIRCPGRFEIYWRRCGLAAEVIYSGSDGESEWPWMIHFKCFFLSVFIHFPCKLVPKSKHEPWMREWQNWGFTLSDDALHLRWNEHSKVWWLPWLYKIHQRHEVRRADGSWVPFVGSWENDKQPDGRDRYIYPYRYVLKNGTVQDRLAAIFIERRAWRPKWFAWTKLFENERQSIDVQFDDEVGERSGSWKGGCTGCGWEMLPCESPEQTLRRMERERVFD